MPIIETGDKYYQCRYKIGELKLLISDKVIDIQPFQIKAISLENNYETDIFPLFKLTLVLSPQMYYDIVKNKNQVKFKVRMQKYYRDLATNINTMDVDYINDTFIVFLDDDEGQFDEELANKRKEADGTTDSNIHLFEVDNAIDFFLFKENYVSNLRKTVNKVFANCTMPTIIAWLFYNAGMKNLLMSPLNNKRVMSSVVIPPMHVFDAIRFLEVQYGFFGQGSLIYFDIYRAYILDYRKGCTAWETNEWKMSTIYVLDRNNKDNRTACWVKRTDENNHYTIVQDEHVKVMNTSIVDNMINGSSTNTIDASSDFNYKFTAHETVTRDASNYDTLNNDTSNSFIGSTHVTQKAALGCVITVAMNDFNIDAIWVNKDFRIVFENSKYNERYQGQYRLSSSFIQFIKDGDDYSISASCVFKKLG